MLAEVNAMIDKEAVSVFRNVRIISVSNLARRLSVDRDQVLSRLSAWESGGLIRIVEGSGCGSCAGCASDCAPDASGSSDEKLLVSQVKELASET